MEGHVQNSALRSYDVSRPRYPEALFHAILNFWGRGRMPAIVDVGCGTGASSQAFHKALKGDCSVIGVEPDRETLAAARADNILPIAYCAGRAEQFPPEVMCADIVTAAQSAQCFDRAAFYRECRRVLARDGVLSVYETMHDWVCSPFLQAHEAFLEEFATDPVTGQRYDRDRHSPPYTQEISPYFEETIEKTLRWATRMKVEHFYQQATGTAAFHSAQARLGEAAVRRYFYSYADLFTDRFGMVTVDYVTKLHAGRVPRF